MLDYLVSLHALRTYDARLSSVFARIADLCWMCDREVESLSPAIAHKHDGTPGGLPYKSDGGVRRTF